MVKIIHSNTSEVVATVDWGFTNPGAMLVWIIDRDRRAFLIHEIYMSKRTIDWWIEKGLDLKAMYGISPFICDPAQPSFIAMFRRAGLNAIEAKNDIMPGIQKVEERLKVQGDGRPRLYILEDCLTEADPALYREYPGDTQPVNTQQEFSAYAWPDGKDGKPNKEVPIDMYNHGMDCVRYLCMYLDTGASGFTQVIVKNPLGVRRRRD